MRSYLLGVTAAFDLAYTLVRSVEALGPDDPGGAVIASARRYAILRRRRMLTGIARSIASLATAAALAPALERRVGATTRPARRAVLVAGWLTLSALAALPVDLVEDHRTERRFGLSERSRDAWLGEQAKGLGVTLVFAVPLVELLAAGMARAPRRWPLLATAASLPLLVAANLIVPLYVMPLFNRFDAYEGALAGAIRDLAGRYGVERPQLLRVDMSKQTKKANAYVTGLFGSHRIVLGDTLLDHFAADEILFVTAHELGHYVARDVWRSVALGTAAAGGLFAFGAGAARRGGPAHALPGLARFAFAATLVSLGSGPLLARASRDRERAADRFALSATNDPGSGVRAFERLRDRNLAEESPPKWMELLFSTHPPLGQRIAALRRAEADASAVSSP